MCLFQKQDITSYLIHIISSSFFLHTLEVKLPLVRPLDTRPASFWCLFVNVHQLVGFFQMLSGIHLVVQPLCFSSWTRLCTLEWDSSSLNYGGFCDADDVLGVFFTALKIFLSPPAGSPFHRLICLMSVAQNTRSSFLFHHIPDGSLGYAQCLLSDFSSFLSFKRSWFSPIGSFLIFISSIWVKLRAKTLTSHAELFNN